MRKKSIYNKLHVYILSVLQSSLFLNVDHALVFHLSYVYNDTLSFVVCTSINKIYDIKFSYIYISREVIDVIYSVIAFIKVFHHLKFYYKDLCI